MKQHQYFNIDTTLQYINFNNQLNQNKNSKILQRVKFKNILPQKKVKIFNLAIAINYRKITYQILQTNKKYFIKKPFSIKMISNLPPNTYLMILVFMEIAMLIFSMLGQFSSGIYFIIIRIIFLVMAQCCKDPKSAAFYSVLALMNAFYAFDPVGLFITGHGQKRTMSANICCVISCALAFIASYIGYYYKLALQKQFFEGGNDAAGNDFNPAYLYNGNNTGYVNPNSRQNNSNPYSGGAGRSNFQPFQGQGHVLG